MENYISILGAVLSIISLGITSVLAYKTLTKDHERSRREKAVDFIIKWSTHLDQKSSLARKYVEQFSVKQTKSLFNQEEVSFGDEDDELFNKIKDLLSEQDNICKDVDRNTDVKEEKDIFKDKNIINKLSYKESSQLRWIIITYLNMLECILVSWQHNVADNKIIEDQFSYLFNLADGNDILKKFRVACGSEKTYPAIEIFYTYLEKKRVENLSRNKKL